MLEGKFDADIPDPEFVHLVRSALAHLYDHALLQNHPLVSLLDLDVNTDQVTRAQGLRRVLLECIETLRPEPSSRYHAQAARAYAILTYRYVDGLPMQEIAGKLALSRRQTYREHRKGLEAIASLLWSRIQGSQGSTGLAGMPRQTGEGTAGDRLVAAQTEVARLQQVVHPELLSLQQVVEEISRLLAPLTQRMGVRIRMSSPETWPLVVADRVILRQTLMNILSYALHTVRTDLAIVASYAKQGFQVYIHELSGEAGSGSQLSDLSEPDEVSLAVAEALVEVQEGTLETGDRGGKWFARIVLPTSSAKTVLVIDDNADIVALFRRYLAGHKVHVVGATDGERAWRMAVEMQPQVITLDVMMPSQDGWEILQRLKSSPETQHIPVVVCSVLNEPQLALSMGASAYITKPVNQVELLEVLLRWMGPLQPAA